MRFILSRFGRIISMYEWLVVQHTADLKSSGRQSALTPSQSPANSLGFASKQQTKDYLLSLREKPVLNVKKSQPEEILQSVSRTAKIEVLVQNYFLNDTRNWRKEFDEEQVQMVPTVTCRICQEKFYANRLERHGDICQNLNNRKHRMSKEQFKDDMGFLKFKTEVTKTMI